MDDERPLLDGDRLGVARVGQVPVGQQLLVLGDAAELPRLASEAGFLDAGPADAVISGLGLLAMDRELVTRILRAAFACLRPDGRFIQFTYGPSNPVKRDVMRELHLSAKRTGFTVWNVPPASVYVITRSKSRGIRPTRAR